jgi:hypothetical protein
MAESGSWPNIGKHGLLSTSALLDLFEVKGPERFAIESCQRTESVTISHPVHGTAVIRDQKPLNEKALRKILDGMSTREYYELLNRKTFFWARRERLERLLTANLYKGRPHDVLTIETRPLVERYENQISIARINSGAFFGSGRRGVGTFKSIEEYQFEEIRKKQKDDAVVEIAVDYAVKDISEITTKVEKWIAEKSVQTIWRRS